VGAQETLALEWLPDLLTALDHGAGGRDTAVGVSLTVETRERLRDALAAGRLDVVFLYDNGVAWPGPHAVVARDKVVVVVAPGHPLTAEETVTPEAVAAARILFAEEGCTSQLLLDGLLAGRAFSEDAGTTVTGSKAALVRLVAQGRGIALLPRLAVARELASGELVALEVAAAPATVDVEACWRDGGGPAERAVHALLRLARRHPLAAAGLADRPARP
jgi:DNA-binding transcriptional LysR family regulator